MTRDIFEDMYSKTLEYFEGFYENDGYPIELYSKGNEDDGIIDYGFWELPTTLQFGVFMHFFSQAKREAALTKLLLNTLPIITDTEHYEQLVITGFQFLEENGYV